jgi:hypothetical protein
VSIIFTDAAHVATERAVLLKRSPLYYCLTQEKDQYQKLAPWGLV